MKRLSLLLLLTAIAAEGFGATCPANNIPVVTLPPHQVAGFSWGNVIRPMNDACVSSIAVEPANDAAWYVGGVSGLYMTKNKGQTWTKPLSGQVNVLRLVMAGPTQLVYAAIGKKLLLSRDHGANWNVIKTFAQPVASVLVANSTLYVGLGWSNHVDPSGVFTSNLGGGLMTFHPFGAGQTGLIVWTLSRNPTNGTLYAGTEIFDHPDPYHPPFFRSTNNAATWTNVAGTLKWHAIDSAVRPADGYVYALLEDPGIYSSANQGNSWIPPNPTSPSLGLSLLMDPKTPTRLYAGRQHAGTQTGGLFLSTNSGNTVQLIGLKGAAVSDIALNGAGTQIYAAAYASGIYTSAVP